MNIEYNRYELGMIGGTFSGLFAATLVLSFFDFKNEPRYIIFGISSIIVLILYLFYKKQLKRQELNNGELPSV